MFSEEIILRQKRADIEQFAERQRLLREAGLAKPSGLRHRLVLVLLRLVARLEPEVEQQQKAKYSSP
jgi:hypothetical protein